MRGLTTAGTLAVLLGCSWPLGAASSAPDRGRKPTWVERGLEVANPVVTVAADAYSGAKDALEKARPIKTSQVPRSLGTRYARVRVAQDRNALLKSGQRVVREVERRSLGAATTAADVGGTAFAYVVEGDLRAVPGVVANAAVKQAATTGGAWAAGGAGAALGSLFGPVGTLVGGVVGAAAGAIGTAMTYDAASNALEEAGYHNVQTFVDSLAAGEPVDYLELARTVHREWLAERAAEQARQAREEATQRLYGDQARSLGLEPGNPSGEVQIVVPARTPPPRPLPTATPWPEPVASLFPDQGMIEIVGGYTETPSFTQLLRDGLGIFEWESKVFLRLRGEKVDGRAESSGKGNKVSGLLRSTDEITGKRQGNVIRGTTKTTYLPRNYEYSWTPDDVRLGLATGPDNRCAVRSSGLGAGTFEWIFLNEKEGVARYSGKAMFTEERSGTCREPAGTRSQTKPYSSENRFRFTWRPL